MLNDCLVSSLQLVLKYWLTCDVFGQFVEFTDFLILMHLM